MDRTDRLSSLQAGVKLNTGLNRYVWCVFAATLLLIGMGGLVTSHEAGLSVPDWPTSYGYNMFLFPISLWRGGIFYEHTHRLVASGVGLLTLILGFWLWRSEERPWVRRLGYGVILLIILQGVLGGLRVTLLKDQLGIVHAVLAQSFLCLIGIIALVTSPRWLALRPSGEAIFKPRQLRFGAWATTGLVLTQLILGASMRHQHAGLAVPDFPLAYGRVWPPTDPAFLAQVNANRQETFGYRPITAAQIDLHMAHRLNAVLILAATGWLAWLSRWRLGTGAVVARVAGAWFLLTLAQAALGAATVWSNKAADVATLHVLLGAVTLASGALLITLVTRLVPVEATARPRALATQLAPASVEPAGLLGPTPAAAKASHS